MVHLYIVRMALWPVCCPGVEGFSTDVVLGKTIPVTVPVQH